MCKEKTNDQIKEEHRNLQKRLEELNNKRQEYDGDGGCCQTQEGVNDIRDEIDSEMDRIRKKQKELYDEYQSRKNDVNA